MADMLVLSLERMKRRCCRFPGPNVLSQVRREWGGSSRIAGCIAATE